MNKNIILLADYRGHFYSSVVYKEASMDVPRLQDYFQERGFSITLKRFPEIDFRTENYRSQYILYQSSEDRDLFYKSYIEDILLGLQLQRAILIPAFELFRAHHNKVFMEILRDTCPYSPIQSVVSKGYGTFEDFKADFLRYSGSVVIKPSAGAASHGVKLLQNDADKEKLGRRISRSFHLMDALKDLVKPYFRYKYIHKSNHRRKFIIQDYVQKLEYDYKILIYWDKYYVLRRQNRKNDFRASGSGLFEWIETVPDELLEFAKAVFESFDCPYISLDIGYDGNTAYLFEMQFLSFGNTTIIRAHCYFSFQEGQWVRVEEKPNLEYEFARSVAYFIESQENKN